MLRAIAQPIWLGRSPTPAALERGFEQGRWKMANARIRYRSGYKYQLVEGYSVKVSIIPTDPIKIEFITLGMDGTLVIKRGYAWDGASGPAIDTRNILRGSLVHDALYQLMRDAGLSKEQWRDEADLELKRICLEDGMSRPRAWWVHRGVRLGGDPSASPESRKPIRTAP